MHSIPTWLRSRIQWLLDPARFTLIVLSLVPLFLLAVFVYVHKQNIAWADELRSLNVVLAVEHKRVPLKEIFTPWGLHYNVFSFLLIALLVLTTRWNILLEPVLTILLAGIILLLLLGLFKRVKPQAVLFILPVFSMLIFSVQQEINWLGIYFGHWYFVILFFLLAISAITLYPGSWRGLLAAAVFCLFATYSSGNGFSSFLIIGALMVFRGYRRWSHFIFWVVVSVISIGLFLSGIGMLGGNSSGTESLSHILSLDTIRFMLIYLGAVFANRFYLGTYRFEPLYNLCMLIGIVGVLNLVVNAIYLFIANKDREAYITWLPIAAFGILPGLMLGAARQQPWYSHPLFSWYATLAIQFWIAVIALAFITIWDIKETGSSSKWLGYSNILMLVGLLTLFIIQNQRVESTSLISGQPATALIGTPITDDCAVKYVFTLDGDCLAEYKSSTDILAAYKLNIFAHTTSISILPAEYRSNDRIVVETDSAWESVHIRDWSLHGINGRNVVFVFPDGLGESVDIPNPLVNTISPSDSIQLHRLKQFVEAADVFWYIHKRGHTSLIAAQLAELQAEGFSNAGENLNRDKTIVIVRYIRER